MIKISPKTPNKCPKCGKKLKKRTGKYGNFLGCSGFPNCKYTYNLHSTKKTSIKKKAYTMNKIIKSRNANPILSTIKLAKKASKSRKNKKKIEEKKETIFILKLEKNKWYIGKTDNLKVELEKHKSQNASSWTKLYKMLSVKEYCKDCYLREKTIEYIKKYGWWNVRGFTFKDENGWPPSEIIDQFEGFEEYEREDNVIYILKLENYKWFVGKTKNLERSMDFHKKGSPPWVDIHKPIEIFKVIEEGNINKITLDLMREFGWENVRGGSWRKWDLKNPPKGFRSNQ